MSVHFWENVLTFFSSFLLLRRGRFRRLYKFDGIQHLLELPACVEARQDALDVDGAHFLGGGCAFGKSQQKIYMQVLKSRPLLV